MEENVLQWHQHNHTMGFVIQRVLTTSVSSTSPHNQNLNTLSKASSISKGYHHPWSRKYGSITSNTHGHTTKPIARVCHHSIDDLRIHSDITEIAPSSSKNAPMTVTQLVSFHHFPFFRGIQRIFGTKSFPCSSSNLQLFIITASPQSSIADTPILGRVQLVCNTKPNMSCRADLQKVMVFGSAHGKA
jgi:hypothetical protein